MELLYALAVSLFITPDCDRLGADAFDVREAATDRLKLWGWIARPELLKLRASTEDPEVLYRVRAIIGTQDGAIKRLQRALILQADYWPAEGFWEEDNRHFVWGEIRRLNVPTWYPSGSKREWDATAPWRICPDYDCRHTRCDGFHWLSRHDRLNMAAYNVRLYLGIRPQAPPPRVK